MLVALAGAAAAAPAAWSTFPGLNGRLAYEARSGSTPADEAGREATAGISTLQPLPGKLQEGTPLPLGHAGDRDAAWSHDGTKIAFVRQRGRNADIYLVDADGRNERRLTGHPAVDADPAFSPDGRQLAFTSSRDGNREIYVMAVERPRRPRRLTFDPAIDQRPDWSPAGTRIAFESARADSNRDIYAMEPDGSAVTRLTFNPISDAHPSWHPEGGKIAFGRGARGARDIFTLSPGTHGATRLTRGGYDAHFPAWSPDGKQIAFTSIANVCQRASRNITRLMTAEGDNPQASGPVCAPGDEAMAVLPASPQPAAEGLNAAWGPLPPPQKKPTPTETVIVEPLDPLEPMAPSPVFVRVEGAVAAAPLVAPLEVPVGTPKAEYATVIDTRGREMKIEAATPRGSTSSVAVSEGRATLSQTRGGVIDLQLPHPCAPGGGTGVVHELRVKTLPQAATSAASRVRAARKPKKKPKDVGVGGSNSKGHSKRTEWTTVDTCGSTITRVRSGVVEVTDLTEPRDCARTPGVRCKRVLVGPGTEQGRKYTARSRR
jgi:Tol biopolymer transport system component